MYKLGDKVKFLNAVGGGVITKIVSKNMVHVENEDGFEIPVLTSEIIMNNEDQPGLKATASEQVAGKPVAEAKKMEKTVETEGPVVSLQGHENPEFYVAFFPENSRNPLDGQTRVYLVNNCNFFLLYHFSHFDGREYISQDSGKLEPNTKLLIETISQAEIANLPRYCFQLICFKEKAERMELPLVKEISINPVKFYKAGSFEKSEFFKEQVMLFKLNETGMDKAIEKLTGKQVRQAIREKEPAIQPEKKKGIPEVVEVDLHMHELIDTTAGLSNKDMLDLQMKKFREEMEAALASHLVKKIIFIHGLGNGTLKQELRRELSMRYRKYPYQDASFQEYGYGATMVILRK